MHVLISVQTNWYLLYLLFCPCTCISQGFNDKSCSVNSQTYTKNEYLSLKILAKAVSLSFQSSWRTPQQSAIVCLITNSLVTLLVSKETSVVGFSLLNNQPKTPHRSFKIFNFCQFKVWPQPGFQQVTLNVRASLRSFKPIMKQIESDTDAFL